MKVILETFESAEYSNGSLRIGASGGWQISLKEPLAHGRVTIISKPQGCHGSDESLLSDELLMVIQDEKVLYCNSLFLLPVSQFNAP